MVKQLACPSCKITIWDMKDQSISSRAKTLGIRTIPAMVIDGQLAECCGERGPSERLLQAAGIGTPLGYGGQVWTE
jgi:glutaredoxin 3